MRISAPVTRCKWLGHIIAVFITLALSTIQTSYATINYAGKGNTVYTQQPIIYLKSTFSLPDIYIEPDWNGTIYIWAGTQPSVIKRPKDINRDNPNIGYGVIQPVLTLSPGMYNCYMQILWFQDHKKSLLQSLMRGWWIAAEYVTNHKYQPNFHCYIDPSSIHTELNHNDLINIEIKREQNKLYTQTITILNSTNKTKRQSVSPMTKLHNTSTNKPIKASTQIEDHNRAEFVIEHYPCDSTDCWYPGIPEFTFHDVSIHTQGDSPDAPLKKWCSQQQGKFNVSFKFSDDYDYDFEFFNRCDKATVTIACTNEEDCTQ
jgi:hypothetical protein